MPCGPCARVPVLVEADVVDSDAEATEEVGVIWEAAEAADT